MPEIIDRRVSFNAGELSPWLDPRIDMDKYRMGCRTLQNMRPAIYGGAMRRPGTVYMGNAKTFGTRLVPFVVNTSTTYILEFTDLLFRVWDATTGALVGAPLEVVTPYEQAQLNELQFCQQNDVLYVAHPSHAPRKIIRTSATVFDLVLLEFTWPATFEENITTTAITAAGTTPSAPAAWSNASVSYTVGTVVTYSAKYYVCLSAHVSSNAKYPLNATYWQETTYSSGVTSTIWSSATTYNVRDRVYISGTPSVEYVCLESNTNLTPAGGANSRYWCRASMTNALAPYSAGQVVSLTSTADLFEAGHVGTQWLISTRREVLKASLAITYANVGMVTEALYCLGEWTCTVTATNAGTNIWEADILVERSFDMFAWEPHISITAGRNAVQSLISGNEEVPIFLRVRLVSGSSSGLPSNMLAELEVGNPVQTGIVQITEYTSSTVVKGIVKLQVPTSAATKRWNKPSFSSVDGFPRAMTLHDGRLFFGGTASQPTTVWGSAVDTYGDFRVAASPDRAVSYVLASDENSAIEWLVSQDMLIMGTTSAEWVYGMRAGEDTPKLRKNTSYGSAAVQAKIANDSVIYIQKSKRKLREYAYSLERDGYASNDLNMLAEHLGDATMVQLAIQRNPETVIYVVTSRGDLLALTYERGQSVVGWQRIVTHAAGGGFFDSVAVVPSTGEEDHVWLTVQRSIGNPGIVTTMVERFAPNVIKAVRNGVNDEIIFVDSAVVRTGSPTTTITGLSHLEGKAVKVLGDGVPQADKTVSSGQITISSASKVIVGLPYTSIIEPSYLETPDPSSMSKAGKKRLTRVIAEYWKSNGISMSADAGTTYTPVVFPVTPTFAATSGSLFSGLHEHFVDASSERQAAIILKTDGALPLNVMSLTMRYQVEMS